MKKVILYITFFLTTSLLNSQIIFNQDIVQGGVAAAGFSTGMGSGSGNFSLYIEPGSTIKKAYLFTYRIGYPPNVPITINNVPYLFDTKSPLMQVNHKSSVASPVHLYYYDFTDSLNANITSNFNVTIPSQPNPINWGYWTISIFVVYENPLLSLTNYSIIINDKDYSGNENYLINGLNPINTSNPVGCSIFIDRACNNTTDGSVIFVNSNNIGVIGIPDAVNNQWSCSGSKGHFYYQNNILIGLDDDTANNTMNGADALANISTYLTNNDTGFNLLLQHINYPNVSTGDENTNLFTLLTYTTPCDTFSTTLSKDTAICLGQTAQLQATGGSKYQWLPQQNLSCYNCPNPTFTGTQTTTYTCRIYNGDSCSKVLPVRIIVQNPKANSLLLTKAFCPNNNGTAQIFADTLLWGKLSFTINANINNTGNFTNLTPGWHNYTITDTLGCAVTDSLFIQAQVNVNAAFTANPKTGFAPLTVNFTNLSNNSTTNYWLITNQQKDTLLSTSNFQPSTFNFEQSGTYTTTLIACNNPPYCCDTISFTILVEDSAAILLPNVFSPNQDGVNDDYQIQLQAAWHFETLQAQIYNRWGEVLQERKFTSTINPMLSNITLWDGFTPVGTPATAGTYFVVVNATLKDGKHINQKIAVSLVR